MTTEVTLFGGKNLPAHLQNLELDATTKALMGGSTFGRRISIRGSVFRMIVDGKQVAENDDRAMSVVIVAAAPHINRQYYAGEYQEDVATAPTCYSEDGKVPNKDSEKIQNPTCDGCPQNISGSGKGDSRACRYQQRLAVVLDGDISGAVYQLALPSTSLFGKGEANRTKLPLQAYVRLIAENGLPISSVVTEMRFDTSVSTPKLTFKAVRPLTEEEFAAAQAAGESADAQQAIKLTVFKQDGEKKAEPAASKSQVKRVEAQTAEPKRTAAEVGVSEVAAEHEPVVVRTPKAAAPAPKRPVADVIAEWDEV